MRVVIVTRTRMLGDALAACLGNRPDIVIGAVVSDLSALQATLLASEADIALIDITDDIDFEKIRAFAGERPKLSLVALGVEEQRRDVVHRAPAVFRGFIARDATSEGSCNAIENAVADHLVKPDRNSQNLLRRVLLWMRRHMS